MNNGVADGGNLGPSRARGRCPSRNKHPSYAISAEDLEALAASGTPLREIVGALCGERLAELETKASA